LFLPLVLLLAAQSSAAAADAGALWRAVRSGNHVVLIRHALAPGTGDPSHFRLDDCSTQRNLNQTGRDQARRIGERFRANGIATAQVFTSQWTRATREWLAGRDLSQPTVLVTHQVNITSLTGVYPASGEMVVARRGARGELEVIGALRAE
jgi:hypothetical protein